MSAQDFVEVINGKLSLSGKPYYFLGTNFWYGIYLGADIDNDGKNRLARELDALTSIGIKNLRVLGCSEIAPYKMALSPAVQSELGVLNEKMLKGLDFLLFEMKKRNMKAVIFLLIFGSGLGECLNMCLGLLESMFTTPILLEIVLMS